MRDIVITRHLPFPRERVWLALTDSDALADWLMPNDFRPEIGHRFTFRTDPAPGFDGIVRCKVLELVPPERLVISWQGGALDTTLSFVLEAAAGGTRLTLRHAGFAGPGALLPRIVLGLGWRRLVARKLPGHLSARPAAGGGTAWH
jgi:uncharacterized protein YndB with AHSA1/START domain